ncbi:PREDICTED: importin subunit alpha-2-like [Populus euphratica]|uniref:Importin subunit alpha-2-like n=1 Tax=Populus euphratica TaxID=75702 RepID=A0AAJ6X9Z9_POPEU|nr:PREDICTED: importin subunit alpha-2-like [Populus euphratica]
MQPISVLFMNMGKGAMQKLVGALRKLRCLLSKSEFPPVYAALKAGAIALFVQCLSFGSQDEQLLEAARSLTNIAAGKSEETKASLPALPLLIAHLGEKSSFPMAEQCARALENFAGEGEELRCVLLSQGALPPLARMMLPFKGSTGPDPKAAMKLIGVDGVLDAILWHSRKEVLFLGNHLMHIIPFASWHIHAAGLEQVLHHICHNFHSGVCYCLFI